MKLIKQGAEAKIYRGDFYGRPCILKERFSKSYRQPALDRSLTAQRIKAEVRALFRCRLHGISVPTVYFVDIDSSCIYMEDITDSCTVREYIVQTQKENGDSAISQLKPLAAKIGGIVGKMHGNNILHGDLTTSNMLLRGSPLDLNIVMIDFGLSYFDSLAENKGVDLYVLERALLSTHPNTEELFTTLLEAYKQANKKGAAEVISKLDEVRMRGRKRTMVG
ncbi:hypothetical protein CHS0354_014778 [Potamilus streckersoni]|uniref:non-specific serine/threonine protein kinase n=1 Tax=Potamilus streckersoni TaxID=2493646 RepID=A0AAE0S7C6_9BIVA|nr:hypothetical protein CHS0354_014778 [Potamilus streckersoni]